MSKRTDVITQAVVAAIGNARAEQSIGVVCESEMLRGMDSLGLMIAFAEIQETLGLKFEPEQLMQLFLCQSIKDMATVIEDTFVQRKSDENAVPVSAPNGFSV